MVIFGILTQLSYKMTPTGGEATHKMAPVGARANYKMSGNEVIYNSNSESPIFWADTLLNRMLNRASSV